MNRRQYSAAQTVRKLLTPGLAISGDSDSWMNLHTHPAMIGYDPGGVHRECPRWGERVAQLRSRFANRSRLVEPARDARPGRSSPGSGSRNCLEAPDCLANQSLLDVSAGGGFVVKELRWPTSWDAIEVRGVLEGTAARLALDGLTHDRTGPVTPLERRVGCDPGSRDRFVCPLSGPERGLSYDARRPRQESHVAVDDKTGSGTPVCCPERLVLAGSMLPRAAEGSAWRMNRTRPWWKRSRCVREPASKAPAREHSLSRSRAATSKPLSTVDSVASCAPGTTWVKLAGAV